jgi:hypothetical protein
VKYLLVANCNREDVSWTEKLPDDWWPIFSVLHRPLARETSAYLEMLGCMDRAASQNRLLLSRMRIPSLAPEDDIAMVQGNPFPHCPDFLERLAGGATHYGVVYECDSTGLPEDSGLNIHAWSEVLGLEKRERYRFSGGTQYRFPASKYWSRPPHFWLALAALCNLEYSNGQANRASWVLERLWPQILGIDL